MTRMPGMDKAAQDLADFNGESGKTGHAGKNESKMGERLDTHGKWIGKVGEIIGVIPVNGLDFVLQWIIDDGVKDRGDRKTILNPEFTKFGVACSKHKIYKTMAVVTFAADYVEKAVALAGDAAWRKALRASLRERLLESPLLAHAKFTRKLEDHCRRAWRAWCDGQSHASAAARQ